VCLGEREVDDDVTRSHWLEFLVKDHATCQALITQIKKGRLSHGNF